MFLYILKWIIIYIILISLFHYLFNFFQKTLTTNKSKDILNYSNIQYSKINNLLNNNNNNQNNQINNQNNSEDYVIGSGQGNTIRNIVEIVFNYFGIGWEEFVNEDPTFLRSGDPKSIISDPSKINNELGWRTKISLEEILIKCVKKFYPNID